MPLRLGVQTALSEQRLPNFVYIGPDKAGSTWIYETLRWHPQVFMSDAKELFFFDQFFDRGLEWYGSFFESADPTHAIVGEISHDYLYSSLARERIAAALPDVKLMVCLREPVSRAFSAYLYMVRQGRVSGTFEEAMESEPELSDHGAYATHLEPYISTFGGDQIYAAVFDDLESDSGTFAKALFGWLEIEARPLPAEKQQRVLAAAAPRFGPLAWAAKRGAMVTRRAGFPAAVTRVKRLSLIQKALYREYGEEDRPPLNPDLRARYTSQFAPEVQRLDDLLSLNLADRWGYK